VEKILAQKLLQIKAIRLNPQNPFQWASGILSPIYCDNRIVLSYPEARDLVKKALAEASADFDFDVVAGVATAGIAHGALLADAIGKPFIYVRSKRKEHGRQNLIEGELKEGAKVLMVEDLISTGGSCLKAVEGVREAGGKVAGVLALFTYGFPESVEAFEKENCPFKTLSNYPAMLEVALENGYLNNDEKELLSEWRKNPKEWAKQFA
jgi:orotate phosphoribosyltransferase